MPSRWFAPRSLLLHAAAIAWVTGCALAAWWQVGRAFQGNQYSYLYAIEWPLFAVVGVLVWWGALRSTRDEAEAREAHRARQDASRASEAAQRRDRDAEGAELAAYNDHLAQLAMSGRKKGWRH